MFPSRDLIFKRVQSAFQARDAALGKVLFSKHDWARTKIVFDLLENAETIVDIGIGQGQLVNLLSECPSVRRVCGVDFRKHSKLIEPKNRDVFEFRQWDITQPADFTIAPADIVVAMEVLEHIDVDRLEGAYHRLRSLSPRGALFVTVPYQEKMPLFNYDKPHGHKQSFDDQKIERIFGGHTIYSDYLQRWYFIFSCNSLPGTKKVKLGELVTLAKECVDNSVAIQ